MYMYKIKINVFPVIYMYDTYNKYILNHKWS